MENDELLSIMALSMTPNIGPVIGRILISHCGSAKAVLEEPIRQLSRIPGIGEVRARYVKREYLELAARELETISGKGIRVLDFLCQEYPKRLRHFENSPLVLYVKGPAALNPPRTVGIVGTRTPTERGRIFTEQLVSDLQGMGVTVVSGLAHGVDGLTHKKCLEYQVPTIGVMGCGLGTSYPAEHKMLYKKMAEQDGALLTEFSYGTGPDKVNFPLRNRIIAALSDALVVIESKRKGGSIITAEFANEYNKDVFAVPGRIDDEYAQGCNDLIKKHKAYLMESVNDLCYIMRWETRPNDQKSVQASLFANLSDQEQNIFEAIRQEKGATMDTLCYRFSKTPSEMATLLLNMEFKGVVRSLPGKKYLVI